MGWVHHLAADQNSDQMDVDVDRSCSTTTESHTTRTSGEAATGRAEITRARGALRRAGPRADRLYARVE